MLADLHPAARLLIWLLLAMVLQVLSWPLLCMLGVLLLCAGDQLRAHWWRLLRRTRVLLLTLCLVFAYGLPGLTPWGLSWLPSYDGLEEAFLHAIRLLVLLGSLAWLIVPLGHRVLMGGLWYLLRPLQAFSVPTDRSVVRLTLVLEYMEKMPEKQDWRQWLAPQAATGELAPVVIALPPWSRRDSLYLFALSLLMLLMLLGGLPWFG